MIAPTPSLSERTRKPSNKRPVSRLRGSQRMPSLTEEEREDLKNFHVVGEVSFLYCCAVFIH
jgi:hypothetical protein